jgi:hypothetical protein
MGAENVEIEVGWRRKYEIPPSSGNLSQLVPPTLADPIEFQFAILIFVRVGWSIDIEYVEKYVIVEGIDR